MDKKELNDILASHALWFAGKGGERANLQGSNLRWGDLWWANLRRANLRKANLQGSNLRWGDLWWADLRGANLQEANLRGADLRGADLPRGIKTYLNEKYPVSITPEKIFIGCKSFTRAEWGSFSDDKIAEMDRGALAWWQEHKENIFKLHDEVLRCISQ
jgi:hypothetical protein